MLRDSVIVVVAVMRTRPQAITLATITMRKSAHGFPFVSHMWDAYGALLGGPLGRQSSSIIERFQPRSAVWKFSDVRESIQQSKRMD